MEMFNIVFGGICIVYVVLIKILEGMHHMDTIRERFPKAYKILTSNSTLVLLVIVGIGLFVEVLINRPKETAPKSEPPLKSTPQSGPATTLGDQSPAITGSGNSVSYGETAKTTKATKTQKK